MTTTGAAEKVEKRRALGRGLDSLLPGPRVVGPAAGRVEAPVEGGDAAGGQQVPLRAFSPVRNDRVSCGARGFVLSPCPVHAGSLLRLKCGCGWDDGGVFVCIGRVA